MDACTPEIVVNRRNPRCKVSVILIDWGVRESFHSLDYLQQQTADRDDYELIWLEFYNRKPADLLRRVQRATEATRPLDRWLIAGYPDETIFNKHRLYNLGLLAAEGQICVICDSDAVFAPTFVEKIVAHFEREPKTTLHLDEIRNNDQRLYPFCYPTIEQILDENYCFNWHGTVSRGLDNSPDMLHHANYGACMAARRDDLLAIGGADEHLDYLGYVCGPYEMTFRLANYGRPERWLRDEYLYHTWHPNQNGINTDFHGPHDGLFMSLRALEARVDRRVQPCLANPWMRDAKPQESVALEALAQRLAERDEPSWRVGNQPTSWDGVFHLEADVEGFNLFLHRNEWFALRVEEGVYDPTRGHRYHPLLKSTTPAHLRQLIAYYNRLPKNPWRRIWTQPLAKLPGRVAKRFSTEMVRLLGR